MIGKILRGYGAVLGSTIRFTALIGVCIGTGFLLVYPLWYLAVRQPGAYTLGFALLLCALLMLILIVTTRKALRAGYRHFALALVRKAVLITGILLFIRFILMYERIIAFSTLVLTGLLYGYLAFVVSTKKRSTDES